MKASNIALVALFGALLVGGGRAEAFVGYGYRANETVRIDRCYRGPAYDYAVPYYMVGPRYRYSGRDCCCSDPAGPRARRKYDSDSLK